MNGVVSMCRFTHRAFSESERLLVSNVDLVITEKCSLRCKDCSNLMQYYSKPQDININLLYDSIDRFCGLVDEIQEFRIIGGETLINKDHYLILAKALSKPNINYIVVYTNGTINLSAMKIPLYQDNRVIVSVTNYGPLSKNFSKLIKTLKNNNIKYHVKTFDTWFDCGRIIPYQDVNVYNLCCGKDLLTILYDKVFKCPFSAHGINLGLLPNYKQDYLNLFEVNKQELKDFIQKRVPASCHHCNGRIYGAETIEPSIQLTSGTKDI
jgi:sulfatase maturation enzyme AslB (radical SAM superfamily)